jgi:hypothetical protein
LLEIELFHIPADVASALSASKIYQRHSDVYVWSKKAWAFQATEVEEIHFDFIKEP